MAPLALQILHVMNSDFNIVHYCSKRVAPLILLKLKIKLRHCSSILLEAIPAMRTKALFLFNLCVWVHSFVFGLHALTFPGIVRLLLGQFRLLVC